MATTSLKATIRRLLAKFKGAPALTREDEGVKNFRESQQKEAAFDSRVRGIRCVALAQIVGSVGRYQDFDSHFRLKHAKPSERLQAINEAMRSGQPLPPVKLYQIKDEYYVLDGNHRIAAAKELGHDEILAHIVEFIPTAGNLQNILYRERAEFADRTQLPQEIQLTEVGQYHHLLEQVAEHQGYLQAERGRPANFKEAALDWYRTIYRPLCAIIDRAGLVESFSGRTRADLYAYISVHQWQQGRQRAYGSGIDPLIPQNMEEFRNKMADSKQFGYPEMQRGVTAFVLMNVQARRESKIVQKLFELAQVREIHSVHGDVDLLVKIELTRDLLSSDAEIISQFVHEKVGQLPGVKNTKTLIPGFSKIKPPQKQESSEVLNGLPKRGL